MDRTLALSRAPRFAAAVLAAGVTWAVASGVVSLGADDHARLEVAIASRQPAVTVAVRDDRAAQSLVLAAASTH